MAEAAVGDADGWSAASVRDVGPPTADRGTDGTKRTPGTDDNGDTAATAGTGDAAATAGTGDTAATAGTGDTAATAGTDGSGTGGGSGTGWRPRVGRWLRTGDGRAVAVLVAVPLALFVVPALFGYPAIAGDNAIQNFPLRVLVGEVVRQGHLPLWNTYMWSGTPILGGLNAGAAYPFTLVFAVLPAVAAWTVNLVVTYWAAGLGVYALLRQFRVRPIAALLAGLTYALTGAMSGQLVHLGVVQGMGWVPLMVLAQLRLSWSLLGTGPEPCDAAEPPPRGSPWPWVALLAGTLGLTVLTGEPRAMAEAEVVATVVTLWLLLRPYGARPPGVRRRATFAGLSVMAGLWGAALGAVQAIPGWSFINASQRASEGYAFFGSGSLYPKWTTLLLVPDLFGGSGIFHQPTYFNAYNLTEVTGYVGLVPLVAAFALLARCFGRHRDRRAPDWGLWLALAGLGLLLSWGEFTPLGHVFVHIPLFGKTRLQSRNLGIVDLALAVLLGFWADRALGRHPEQAGLGTARRRWFAAVPALAAALMCLVVIALPGPIERALGSAAAGGSLGRSLTFWFIAQLLVATAVVALVLGWPRLRRLSRRRWLTVVVLVDIGLFMVSTSTGLSDGNAVVEPTTATATAVLGNDGRFAIYDTTGVVEGLDEIGQPDLNVITKLPSVQGYGSILSNGYGTATGTHTLDTLDPCALADGTFVPLRLGSLLTLPTFVAPPVPSNGQTAPAPPACPGAPRTGTATRRDFTLGQLLTVTSVEVEEVAGSPPARRPLRLGVTAPSGRVGFPTQTVRRSAGGWAVRFARPQRTIGLVVTGPASSVSPTSVVSTSDGQRWSLDGVLQEALSVPGWRYLGTWEGFARYRATAVRPPVWIAGPAAGATARLVDSTEWGSAVVRVASPRPVTVVRSEAYLVGWHARAVPADGGAARTLPVSASGLVQSVRVPAGRWTVTFDYHPHGLDAGLAASAAGMVAMVAVGVWGLVVLGRRRRPAGR